MDTLSLIAQTVAGSENQLCRTVLQIALRAGVTPGLRCQPGCTKWHTLEETMELMSVKSKSTIYEYEARGLRRANGGVKYLHTEIDRFMWEGSSR